MASRKSLRLAGMKPDLKVFQDKCFICQPNIDVGNVSLAVPCHAAGNSNPNVVYENQLRGPGNADTVVTKRNNGTLEVSKKAKGETANC